MPNFSSVILSFLICFCTWSMELQRQDVEFLDTFLTDFLTKSISKAVNPMVALYFENMLREFNVDPNKTFPQRIDLNQYIIPPNQRGKPGSIKSAGMFLSVTTDTINENIRNLMPRFLKVMKNTEVPFLYQVGPLLIKSLLFTIPEDQDPNWFTVETHADSNSIILDISDVKFNIRKKIFFSLLIEKFEGFVNVTTVMKKMRIKVTFLRDMTKYYFKPRVICVVTEMNIDEDSLWIKTEIENIPSTFAAMISMIFKSQIKDSVEFYVKNTMHKDTTEQINLLIQKFFRDSIDIDEGLAINVLLTENIIVEEGQVQLRIAGQFFDYEKPYAILENPENISDFYKDNPGVQFGLSRLSLESFFKTFFSRQKNYFIEKQYSGLSINARISFEDAVFVIAESGINISNVEIGLFCDDPADWKCIEIMKLSLNLKLDLFNPYLGMISLQNVVPELTESGLVQFIGGKFKEALYIGVVNQFIRQIPLDYIKIDPLPIPDFVKLNNLLFTHYEGFVFMETTLALTDLFLI